MDIEPILIEADPDALKRAIEADPQLVDAAVTRGDHAFHPIHALCDRVFEGDMAEQDALKLVEVLINAGANLAHIHPRNNDTLLTRAISLSCPTIAQALLDAGAPKTGVGQFGATPLYWAAIMGMPDLVRQLIDPDLLKRHDDEFGSTPLGWAVEGWAHPPKGSRGGQVECAKRLVDAGSVVEPQWVTSGRIRDDAAMREALRL